jgi:hypothetical protein
VSEREQEKSHQKSLFRPPDYPPEKRCNYSG